MRRWPYPAALLLALLPGLLAGTPGAAETTRPKAAEAPARWGAPIPMAAGPGERGPWRQNDSRYHYVDDPAIMLDADGTAIVAWVDQSLKDVFVQRVDAAGTREPALPVNISHSPDTFSWLPRIATGAGREVHVLWQEIIFSGGSHGGDMLYARSTDGGRHFGPPINLSSSVGGDGKGRITPEVWHNGSFDIAVDPRDGGSRVAIAWTEYDGPLWFMRSVDGGESFSQPRVIAGGKGEAPARAPRLALRGEQVLVAWTSGDDAGADIRVARSADGGDSFAAPTVVEPNASYSDAPTLAIDGNGIVHLAFAESDGGPFGRYHLRIARSEDGGRSFGRVARASGPLPSPYASIGFPELKVDRRGRLHLLAHLFSPNRPRPQAIGLMTSDDGGRRFGPLALVPGNAVRGEEVLGSQQGLLVQKLAVHPDGGIAIANSSLLPDTGSKVWVQFAR